MGSETLPDEEIEAKVRIADPEAFRRRLAGRGRRAGETLFEVNRLFDDAEGVLEECERLLGRDLRSYVRRDFFKAHLSRYSKSRRKAPIYWHLAVPSRNWGLWLYAPAMTREMLFAIVRECRRKERQLAQERKRWQQQAAAASGRERQRLVRRLDETESVLGEVHAFLKEAERVTNIGWEPDLDDGLILCAAPLADLMPAWQKPGRPSGKNPADPRHARTLIKRGTFPWATVSRWKDDL